VLIKDLSALYAEGKVSADTKELIGFHLKVCSQCSADYEAKQEEESAGAGLHTAYAAAHENAKKMRDLHDKLVNDINSLTARRQTILAKVAVAKTQEKVNRMGSKADKMQGSLRAFERMEQKADGMLDRANAISELNQEPIDEAKALEEKYRSANTNASVDAELEEMKKNLGL